MNNGIFAYCLPDGEVSPWSGQLATQMVQCTLCGATFPWSATYHGTLDLDADSCPKCLPNESTTR